MQKNIYIQFLGDVSEERISKYIAHYGTEYRKVMPHAYIISVPPSVKSLDANAWAKTCFPRDEFVLCFGSVYHSGIGFAATFTVAPEE